MPFVQRNNLGKVIGRFANPQPGVAEEWLDDGHPDLSPTQQQLIELTLARARTERKPIIGVLDGLQASALALGDGSATEIETVKQGLRDITKIDLSACSTEDEMRAAIMSAYALLVTAHPAVASAFKEVLS